MDLSRSVFESPVGPLTLVASERGLCAILWPDRKASKKNPDQGPKSGRHPVLGRTARQLKEYFGGARRAFELPLDALGSDFDLRVWRGLRAIGYGSTLSYGALARAIGNAKASRAVGGATGRNPIPIVVPCHRLIGSDGGLGGFSGGLGVKRWLLNFESGVASKPKVFSANIMHDKGTVRTPH
ncbi:MAG TPA: methylated-DNA--[protein]-cysteine S-methyltransferase [bacterium]|nr:methylated-DNA--[protein]-cysteine S-methyltransferase [bacterium]